MLTLYHARVILTVWDVEYTDQFEEWWESLSVDEQAAIDVAIEVLQEKGPGLGRPLVDTVKGSRHSNMKELRPGGFIRILFVAVADRLFDEHLVEVGEVGGTR